MLTLAVLPSGLYAQISDFSQDTLGDIIVDEPFFLAYVIRVGASGATNVAFTDTLPVGVTVDSGFVDSTSCGGSVTAVPGSSNVAFTAASIPDTGGGGCSVRVAVVASSVGPFNIMPSDLTADMSGPIAPAGLVIAPEPVAAWIVASGTFNQSANWSAGAVPDATDLVRIRNGGAATGDAPASITLGNLVVGDQLGTGSLALSGVNLNVVGAAPFEGEIQIGTTSGLAAGGPLNDADGEMTVTDSDSLMTANDFGIGGLGSSFGVPANASGTAAMTIERVATVSVGGALSVGNARADAEDFTLENNSASTDASLTIRDVNTLQTGGDFDIADGEANAGPGASARATTDSRATVLIERISTLTVGSDIDVGSVSGNEFESEEVFADAIFRDIDSLTVSADVDFLGRGAVGTGAAAGSVLVDATLTIERSTVAVPNGRLQLHAVDIGGEGVFNATGALNLVDTEFTLNGAQGSAIGTLAFPSDDPTGANGVGAPGNSLSAALNLTRSLYSTSQQIELGTKPAGLPTALDAVIDLDAGSHLQTGGLLTAGADGRLELHIDGLIRATALNAGDEGTYASINAFNTGIAGDIDIVFDIVPPAGHHTFDLIVTDVSFGLDSFTGNLSLERLDEGFSVETFGVVEAGDVDVLRLIIDGDPINPPGPIDPPGSGDANTNLAAEIPVFAPWALALVILSVIAVSLRFQSLAGRMREM
ncbi:MAG: hypothetical protein AAGI11_12820 [Pseudomonadota bacterium]